MKKKSVKLLSSVAVLGILCAGYFGVKTYVENQEKKEAAAEEEEEKDVTLFSASSENLESLSFMIGDKEEVFLYDREQDLWTKQDEEDFPVSQDKMSEAAGAVSGMNADRVLEDVDNVSEYGLDVPQNTITVKADGEEAVFRIGSLNEGVSQYYVTKDGEDNTVYLVAEALIEPFLGDLYDYAQGEDFPAIESSNVSDVDVKQEQNEYSLAKDKENGLWEVSDGERSEKADTAAANSLTSSVSALEFDSFVDYDAEDLMEYGLENPYAVLTVDYEEEAEVEESTEDEEKSVEAEETESEEDTEEQEVEMVQKHLELYIGDQAEEETRYVCLGGSNEVYTITEESLSSFLDKSISDFLDFSVGYPNKNQVENMSISYQNATNEIDVSRETSENEDGEEEETVTYLLNGAEIQDTTLFDTFYNKLTAMTAQKRLLEDYRPESSSEMTTSVTTTDGSNMKVDFYSYDTNFYAVVVDEKVYLVNKVNVKEMFQAYENFVAGDEEAS